MDGFKFVDDTVCMVTLYSHVYDKVVCIPTAWCTCIVSKESHNIWILIPWQVVSELCRVWVHLPVAFRILLGDLHDEQSLSCSACAWKTSPDLCQLILEFLTNMHNTHTTQLAKYVWIVDTIMLYKVWWCVCVMCYVLEGSDNVYTMFCNVYVIYDVPLVFWLCVCQRSSLSCCSLAWNHDAVTRSRVMSFLSPPICRPTSWDFVR